MQSDELGEKWANSGSAHRVVPVTRLITSSKSMSACFGECHWEHSVYVSRYTPGHRLETLIRDL
jgi:hypothetical protein